MTARELNDLFERHGLGHVRLEQPFLEDGSKEVRAVVTDDSGSEIRKDKWHFGQIVINDSTFGYEPISEDGITDDDYDCFEINDLQFYTTNWAYPRATIDECGGSMEVAERNCGIRLTDYVMNENVGNAVDAYAEQAVKAYLEPLEYQNWLLKMFLDEQTLFIEKHYPLLKELGYHMTENGIYKRGFECE